LLALPLQRSGFNRFYQHLRWKILIPGKTFRARRKTRHNLRVFSRFKKLSYGDGGDDDGDGGYERWQESLTLPERLVLWQQGIRREAS
jgi:hypothetical protein